MVWAVIGAIALIVVMVVIAKRVTNYLMSGNHWENG